MKTEYKNLLVASVIKSGCCAVLDNDQTSFLPHHYMIHLQRTERTCLCHEENVNKYIYLKKNLMENTHQSDTCEAKHGCHHIYTYTSQDYW